MKLLKIILVLSGIAIFGQAQQKMTIADFEFLNNTEWSGNLMYLNYSDNKEVNLPTELKLEIKKNTLIMKTSFPYEPKANGKNRIAIDLENGLFGDERIISIDNEEGSITLITEFEGKDNNRLAVMTKTYVLGKTGLDISKEVAYKGSNSSFIRNKYTYKRK